MSNDRNVSDMAFSIVIPAHNEGSVIGDLLLALEPLRDRAEIVVVANGCTDGTADVVRATAPWISLVELPVGSKPLALRAGDEAVSAFPRMYLDSDVHIDERGLAEMCRILEDGQLLAVAATPDHDLRRSSWAVKSHYRIWTKLTSNRTGLGGANPQMLSAEARSRFDEWPDVIGDDYFLDGLFSESEAARVPSVRAVRIAPTGVIDCVSRKARIHAGNEAVLEQGLRSTHAGGGGLRELARIVRAGPVRVVDLPAHLTITIASRLVFRWRRFRGHHRVFYRDGSRV
jgi:hypothetical protein